MPAAEPDKTKILREGLLSLDIPAADEQMEQFSVYLSELKKWNRAYNLTGLRNDKDIVIKHFLDSLLYLRPAQKGCARAADVGSGAGFPGIPVKIVRPGIEMYLVEPSSKKAAFLRHILRKLRLRGIEVIEKRIEEITLSKEILTPVDVVMSRALFDIREFVRKASHILKPGGIFVLSKGPKVAEELKQAGGLKCELLKIPLPQTDIMRYLVVVRAKDGVSA